MCCADKLLTVYSSFMWTATMYITCTCLQAHMHNDSLQATSPALSANLAVFAKTLTRVRNRKTASTEVQKKKTRRKYCRRPELIPQSTSTGVTTALMMKKKYTPSKEATMLMTIRSWLVWVVFSFLFLFQNSLSTTVSN